MRYSTGIILCIFAALANWVFSNEEHPMIRNSADHVGRSLTVFGKATYCEKTGDKTYKTVQIPKWRVRAYKRQNPDSVAGNCGKACKTLCAHKACAADIVATDEACTCIDDAASTTTCDVNAICNTSTETCTCQPGYVGDGSSCSDIDECATGTHNCAATSAMCNNTVGSYTCVPCQSGFVGDGKVCTDIDECSTGTANCGPNSDCTNTPGNFTCACKPGYKISPISGLCVDIHECVTNTDDCDSDAICTNTVGSYTCACKPGFSGNGKSCSDINECLLNTDDCDPNAICTNTPGSYKCDCKKGYSMDLGQLLSPGMHDPGSKCVDINECADKTDNCDDNAICTNTPGSFTCACKSGFDGNGISCTDRNECALGTANCNGANRQCINSFGGYSCACKPGYREQGSACVNINECLEGYAKCNPLLNCVDTPGSYDCLPDCPKEGISFDCVHT